MQLSCNVIKNSNISSEATYTINMPCFKVEEEVVEEVVEEEIKEEVIEEEVESVDLNAMLEDAIRQAESMIEDARRQSVQIISSAASEAEKMKKDAYELAYKKGYDEGLNEGTAKGKDEGFHQVDEIRKTAEDVLKDAHRVSRKYIEDQKDEIIKLAFSIAEKVIEYEVDASDIAIMNIVNKAIDNAVSKGQVTIKVNPIDYAVLDCRRDELKEMIGENSIVEILKDNSIRRGGCTIDTGLSIVDATIDGQLEKIREALLG